MNIHPLIVHFPIALLTLYSVLEVIRRWTKQDFWKPLRGILVIIGTLGAFASLQSGEIAEHAYAKMQTFRSVLEFHSAMANVTTYIFATLAVCYVLEFLQKKNYLTSPPWLVSLQRMILNSPIAYVLALLGFGTLGLTGALGGILVYGPNADFVTSTVFKMLF